MQENHSTATPTALNKKNPKSKTNKHLWAMISITGFSLLLTIIGSFIALTATQQTQDIRQEAATGNTGVMIEAPASIKKGTDIPVNIKLDAGGKSITAVAMKITFNPQLVKVKSASKAATATPLVELRPVAIDETAGSITIIYGVPASTGVFTGSQVISNLVFESKNVGSATFQFDQSVTTATELNNPADNVLINRVPASTTITDSTPTSDDPVPGRINPPSNITSTSMTLTWTAAEDRNTPNTQLQYLLCAIPVMEGETTNNQTQSFDETGLIESSEEELIDSLNEDFVTIDEQSLTETAVTPSASADIATCENRKVMDYTANVLTRNVTGLVSNRNYKFNVVVKNNLGKKALYSPVTAKTLPTTSPAPNPVTCQWCGTECKEAISGQTGCTTNPQDGKMCVAKVGGTGCEAVPISTQSATLTFNFKLQGLEKADVSVPMELTTRNVPSTVCTAEGAIQPDGTTCFTRVQEDKYTLVAKSTTQGVVMGSVILNKLNPNFTGQLEILVKPTVALRRKIGTISIVATQKSYSVTAETNNIVKVGDFVRGVDAQGRDQTNVLGTVDINRIIQVLRAANDVFVTVNDSNREFDVDYNGIINVRDIAFAKNNLDDVVLPGE